MLYCCACKKCKIKFLSHNITLEIMHDGTYTRILNSYTNEDVNIHFQCYEHVNVQG